LRAEFQERLDLKAQPRRIVTALGIAGYLARAVVFTMIGVFLTFAAIDARSHEATGLAGALRVIQGWQPYGSALLGLAAAGLIAFGVYGLAEAASRRIAPSGTLVKRPAWLGV
jgi:uncharacterized protein DUF1206